jgi:hypothetical protein
MSATLGDTVEAIREMVDEVNPGFYTDKSLRRWVNAGVREIARRSEWKRGTTTEQTTASVRYVTVPDDVVRVSRVEIENSDGRIWRLKYRDTNAMDSIWGAGQGTWEGTPTYYTLQGANPLTIVLFPVPNEVLDVHMHYYGMPVDLALDGSDDGEVLDVPTGWEDLVVDWGTVEAFRKLRDVAQYQLALSQFQSKLGALVEMAVRYTDEPTEVFNVTPMDEFYGEW